MINKNIKRELKGKMQDFGRRMEKYGHKSPDILKRMEECETKLKRHEVAVR